VIPPNPTTPAPTAICSSSTANPSPPPRPRCVRCAPARSSLFSLPDLIDSRFLQGSSGRELVAALMGNPGLCAASERLRAAPERQISSGPEGPRHVYVFQREYATVDPARVEVRAQDLAVWSSRACGSLVRSASFESAGGIELLLHCSIFFISHGGNHTCCGRDKGSCDCCFLVNGHYICRHSWSSLWKLDVCFDLLTQIGRLVLSLWF
jgi:hypothetical protein